MNKPSRKLEGARRYTVGWIAPLPIERAAAEALFDQVHNRPVEFQQPASDNLSYTWGSIAEHNIVLASLKAGVYGTTSAATVANSMLRSFPDIRFGLLVGIGAAIPRNDCDIRLGDIVVSEPDGSNGGIIQYDLLKARKGGQREHKDFLNSPPEVLLYALANLKSQHERAPSLVPGFLKEMASKYPHMVRYKHQGRINDRLFQSTYEHGDHHDCSRCSRDQEIRRETRNSANPEIHYGVIASGNTLVKDASARRDLLRHIPANCICYEMEAAGLMNSFPCLAIRGISDYADSHKNDMWQRYAAATAAAFAKELLGYVPADRTDRERKAIDVLQQISSVRDTTNKIVLEQKIKEWLAPPDTSTNFFRARELRHDGSCLWFLEGSSFQQWKQESSSFMWLYGHPGCGKTVLSSAIIQCLGKMDDNPAGATVLYFHFDFNDPLKQNLNAMVRSLTYQLFLLRPDAQIVLEDMYGDHWQKQEQPETPLLLKALQSMIRKAGNVKVVLDALDEVKNERNRRELLSWITKTFGSGSGSGPFGLIALSRSEYDIQKALRSVGRPIPIRRVDVDHDIREYVEARVQYLQLSKNWNMTPNQLNDISAMVAKKAEGMFRLAACQLDSLEKCLDLAALEQAMDSLPTTLTEMYNSIILEIPEQQRPAAIRLLQLLTFAKRPLRLDEIVDALAVDVYRSRTFDVKYRLWKPEDLVQLCSSLVIMESVTSRQFSHELYTHGEDDIQLTKTLQEFKMKILPLMKKEKASESFLRSAGSSGSRRTWLPLTLLGDSFMHEEHCSDEAQVQVVRFAHFSVAEYIRSDRVNPALGAFFIEHHVQSMITRISLQYLIHISRNPFNSRVSTIRKKYPFVEYASRYWHVHAKGGSDFAAFQTVLDFFLDAKAFRTWMLIFRQPRGEIYRSMTTSNPLENQEEVDILDKTLEIPSPLYVAVMFGLNHTVQEMVRIDSKPHVLETSSDCDKYDHRDFVAFFVTDSLECYTIRDSPIKRTSPLYAASRTGQRSLVQYLIEGGSSVFDEGGPHGSALDIACHKGDERMVATLLNWDSSNDRDGTKYSNAVKAAFCQGHWSIMQRLFEKGAHCPLDYVEWIGRFISERKNESRFTELVLQATFEGKSSIWSVVVQKAVLEAFKTTESMMKVSSPFLRPSLLSDRTRAILNAASKGKSWMMEAHLAAKNNDIDFLEILLFNGNPTVPNLSSAILANYDSAGRSLLHHAAENGHLETVQLLISAGLSLDKKDKAGHTPLHYAVANEHVRLFDVLSPSSTSLDWEIARAKMNRGGRDLFQAARTGDAQSIAAVIESSWSKTFANDKDEHGSTPLHYAVKSESLDLIRYLIAKGADPTVKDWNLRRPLYYAVRSGNLEVVKAVFPKVAFSRWDNDWPLSAFAKFDGYPELERWLLLQEAIIILDD